LNQMIASQLKPNLRKVLRVTYYNTISNKIKVSSRLEILLILYE